MRDNAEQARYESATIAKSAATTTRAAIKPAHHKRAACGLLRDRRALRLRAADSAGQSQKTLGKLLDAAQGIV